MADSIFTEEQDHLSQTYKTLVKLRDDLTTKLEVTHKKAAQDLKDMSEEVSLDFGGADETMETLAAIETLNSVIDVYNQSHDFDVDRLRRTLLLLNQPYFAKVTLQMRPGRPVRDVYIGSVGMTDEHRRPLVVDWRSPVAETYYNQETGETSYKVDGRERKVNLLLRRQFDIVQDKLLSYFDTTVAIQDSLLLSVLRHQHTEKLQAITATIQREQNEVVRHADVPALLVNGIAGSGKTSVLLQRIAFLFYQERDTLTADQVYLFTPNTVFKHYVDAVLPSLGESNPQTLIWREFVAQAGLADRDPGVSTTAGDLKLYEEAVPSLILKAQDFHDIKVANRTLIRASQVAAAYEKLSRLKTGPRKSAQVKEALHQKIESKLKSLASADDIEEEMFALDLDEQVEIFGEPLNPADDEETRELIKTFINHRYGVGHELVEQAEWLRVDRVGMRISHKTSLNALEALYLRLLIVGGGAPQARYVMVDEVQDYTEAQLMVLVRYFSQAHFLLLGDENQAIKEGTASWDAIRQVFTKTNHEVAECSLMTSYRSTPEITSLFTSLMDPDERIKTTSVQREGTAPHICPCTSTDEYLATLHTMAEQAKQDEGLTAFVVRDKSRVHWLAKQLGQSVVVVGQADRLPASGVILLDLTLAKGLEFDHVIVCDAQEEVYPATPLSRRCLYTALSRATHRVSIVSQGALTPLLDH